MSRLPFELLLALRYLRPKRTFVSIITLISVMGVTLGVAVLIIVISVMSGFDRELRDKVFGFNSHLTILQVDPESGHTVPMVNAALVNFTRGVSRELARHNVRINSISPGWTLTENLRRSIELKANAQGIEVSEALQREARAIPTGRHVTMAEIANMTLLAVSDLCPSLTGEDIIIDGGATPSI